jgi:hypothetical protein
MCHSQLEIRILIPLESIMRFRCFGYFIIIRNTVKSSAVIRESHRIQHFRSVWVRGYGSKVF